MRRGEKIVSVCMLMTLESVWCVITNTIVIVNGILDDHFTGFVRNYKNMDKKGMGIL